MQKLISFTPFFALQIQANLEIKNQILHFDFQWQDPQKNIKFPDSKISKRAHQLWQNTCFEAFIRPAENLDREINSFYYEFNMSPAGSWNLYSFDAYRNPQPPRESNDFLFKESKLEGQHFSANWEMTKPLQKIEFSLNAVIELQTGEKTYWALRHLNDKPDFHNLDSFTLEMQIMQQTEGP